MCIPQVLYLTTVMSVLSAAYALRTEFPGLFKESIFRCGHPSPSPSLSLFPPLIAHCTIVPLPDLYLHDRLNRLRAKYAEKEGVVTLQKPTLLELLEKAVLKVTRNMYRMTDENTIALGTLLGAAGAEALVFSNPSSPSVTVSKRFTLRSSESGVEMNPLQKKGSPPPPPPPSPSPAPAPPPAAAAASNASTNVINDSSTTIIISNGADSDDEYG